MVNMVKTQIGKLQAQFQVGYKGLFFLRYCANKQSGLLMVQIKKVGLNVGEMREQYP